MHLLKGKSLAQPGCTWCINTVCPWRCAQGIGQCAATSEVESAPRPAAAVTVGELDFAVDQYIVIGSPLGLFLALRKVLRTALPGRRFGLQLQCRDLDTNIGRH